MLLGQLFGSVGQNVLKKFNNSSDQGSGYQKSVCVNVKKYVQPG